MLNESTDPAKPVFPKEMEFWRYNTSGWGILTIFLIVSTFLGGGTPVQDLIFSFDFVFLIWGCIEGTIAGLIFRRWYHQKHWHKGGFLSISLHLLLLGILSAIAFGITVAAGIYFFLEVPAEFLKANGSLNVMDFLLNSTRVNGIIAFTLVILWCVTYLNIKGSRNAKELAFKALELESSLKEAKLNALSGQINPHFLFNALNNIRFMIHEDARRADESLISLSEILRHSLESSKNEKVELAQEFVIVKQYLKLMKNQMEDRLTYSIELDPTMEKLLIPPMIVQMLTENAIKHGVEHQKQGGSVSIDCSETPDSLTIKVSNTIASTAPLANFEENKDGLGLENINNRLSLLYGSKARLSISQQKDVVTAKLDLPKELT